MGAGARFFSASTHGKRARQDPEQGFERASDLIREARRVPRRTGLQLDPTRPRRLISSGVWDVVQR